MLKIKDFSNCVNVAAISGCAPQSIVALPEPGFSGSDRLVKTIRFERNTNTFGVPPAALWCSSKIKPPAQQRSRSGVKVRRCGEL
jgi:hypothetical protein